MLGNIDNATVVELDGMQRVLRFWRPVQRSRWPTVSGAMLQRRSSTSGLSGRGNRDWRRQLPDAHQRRAGEQQQQPARPPHRRCAGRGDAGGERPMDVKASHFIPPPRSPSTIPSCKLRSYAQRNHRRLQKRLAAMFCRRQRARRSAAPAGRRPPNGARCESLPDAARAGRSSNDGQRHAGAVGRRSATRRIGTSLDIARAARRPARRQEQEHGQRGNRAEPALERARDRRARNRPGRVHLQITGETPSHIVAPIVHKSKESVRDLFVAQAAMPPTDDAEEMTQFARQILRRSFLEADMGISGGNFIIAETGSVVPGDQRRQRAHGDDDCRASTWRSSASRK